MFEHAEPAEYVLDRLSFTHEKLHYTGRGILTWDPEKGFHVNAFLDQAGPDSRFRDSGTVEVQDKSDQNPVRFKGYGFHGVVPRVFERTLRSLLHERRLSFRPENAIFFRRRLGSWKDQTEPKLWSGLAVYSYEKDFDFPDQVRTATTLNEQPIQTSTKPGLSYAEDNGLSVWGRQTGENLFTVTWGLPQSVASRTCSWEWAEAIRRALSILSGQTVWLVKREILRGWLEITELRPKRPVEVLSAVHRPLTEAGDPQRWKWNKSAFMQLSRFFAAGGTEADVCWSLFRRLAEASRQDTWESRELVQATALEASLRTLDNHPFVPRDRTWDLRHSLESFFRTHLDSRWTPVCTRVLETARRLRHRNAHPDWITHRDGSFSKPEWRESIEDITYLSRFYGYMILALAGVNDIGPRFPQVRFKN